MATGNVISSLKEFKPRLIGIHLEFRRVTPIASINLNDLREAIKAPEGGYDIGVRKEAVILDISSGRIIIAADGSIVSRFRGMPVEQVEEMITGVFSHICKTFDWVPEEETFLIDADLIEEVSGNNPKQLLLRAVKQEYLTKLAGLNKGQKIHAVGYTIFLSDLSDRARDFRIRLEPLSIDPERKFYLRITNVKRDASFQDLSNVLHEMADRALQIISHLRVMKDE